MPLGQQIRYSNNRRRPCLPAVSWLPAVLIVVLSPAWPIECMSRAYAAEGESLAELERLGDVCEQLGLDAAADVSRSWAEKPRADQLPLYLPVGKSLKDVGVSESPTATKWIGHFNECRVARAELFFQRAESLANDNQAAAYRLLWKCLREDPDHKFASKILGGLARAVAAKPRVRSGSGPQPELNWAPRTYLLATTPHFNLVSKAGRGETLRFAQQLEQYYALWTQVFAPVWLQDGKLADALERKIPLAVRRNRVDVVLLPDRNSYLKMLSQSEDNAGVSVGYYSPTAGKSLFYIADDLQDTLHHELTHQLLAECCGFSDALSAGKNQDYWLVEGIAIYMESLKRRGFSWSVGGWDSPRLQTARYRGVRDGFWPKMREFAGGGIEAWKLDPEIATLYSHAAGLTHMFMDRRVSPASRREFLGTLNGVYSGAGSSIELLQTLGGTDTSAMQSYQELMTVTDADVQMLNVRTPQDVSPRDLVLAGSRLADESWATIAKFAKHTRWLDCAYTNLSQQHLSQIVASAGGLSRLSLEGTQVDAQMLTSVSDLRQLKELDLSDSPVDDQMLKAIASVPGLETLWLTGTKITASSLSLLRSMTKLQRCDLSGTRIPANQQKSWK